MLYQVIVSLKCALLGIKVQLEGYYLSQRLGALCFYFTLLLALFILLGYFQYLPQHYQYNSSIKLLLSFLVQFPLGSMFLFKQPSDPCGGLLDLPYYPSFFQSYLKFPKLFIQVQVNQWYNSLSFKQIDQGYLICPSYYIQAY